MPFKKGAPVRPGEYIYQEVLTIIPTTDDNSK